MVNRTSAFIAFSLIPASYFFGMTAENWSTYEPSRLKKKMSAIIRGIEVDAGKIPIEFRNVHRGIYLVTGYELCAGAVRGLEPLYLEKLPQEVIDKVCSLNTWENFEGVLYVHPEVLQKGIFDIARERATLYQGQWIRSRIWYRYANEYPKGVGDYNE